MESSEQAKMNWETFQNLDEDVKIKNHGRTALLHDGELIAIYNDSGDAYDIGCEKFKLGNFSIQTFGVGPIHLGIHTPLVSESAG